MGYFEGKPQGFSEGNNRGKLWSLGGGGGQTLRLLQRVKRRRTKNRIMIFSRPKGTGDETLLPKERAIAEAIHNIIFSVHLELYGLQFRKITESRLTTARSIE
jgi:hypothetical protein